MVQKPSYKETDRFSTVVCPLNENYKFTGKCAITCCSLHVTTAHGCVGLDLPELKFSIDEVAAYKGLSLIQTQHMLTHSETAYQSMLVLQRMSSACPKADTAVWPFNDSWLEKPVDPSYAFDKENFDKFRIPKSKLTFEQFKTFLEGNSNGRKKDCSSGKDGSSDK